MDEKFVGHLLSAGIFSLMGLLIFAVLFFLIVKCSPFSIRKEIEEDQNISLAILIGSVFIGVAIIIAAAVHG